MPIPSKVSDQRAGGNFSFTASGTFDVGPDPATILAFAAAIGGSSAVRINSITIGGIAMTMLEDRSMQVEYGTAGRCRGAELIGSALTGPQAWTASCTLLDGTPDNNARPIVVLQAFKDGVSATTQNRTAVAVSAGAIFSSTIASSVNARAIFIGLRTTAAVTATAPTAKDSDGTFPDGTSFQGLGLSEPGATSSTLEAVSSVTDVFIGQLWSLEGAAAGDTTAPSITSSSGGSANGPFAVNVAENSTAVAVTLTSDEALASVTKGGADGALFTLAGSGTTRTLAPSSAFNFEALPHANPFVVTLAFADAAGNTRNVTVNFTVTNVAEPPGAPTAVVATAGNGSASVAFTPPAPNGGPSVTGYTVTASPGGATATGGASPITVTGLTNGTAYTFTVTATNVEGTSVPSAASSAVTPAAVTYTALTDIVAQAGIPIAEGTTVYWTWLQAGRPGAAAAVVHGSSLANAAGRVTVSHTVAGDGLVLLGLRPGPAISNDRVFAQFLTLA